MNFHLFLLSFFSLSFLAVTLPTGLGSQLSQISKVEWLTEDTHDFGDIPQKKPVKYDFRFRNISGEPLVIDNVRPLLRLHGAQLGCRCRAAGQHGRHFH